MAEHGRELQALEARMERLLRGGEPRRDGRRFCSDFCSLVEQHTSRWQRPLPQLRVLQVALCYFTRASASFMSDCEHMLDTLSSLALSIFELLLFFDQKDFDQELLKQFSVVLQECHVVLSARQNVHLLQVERVVRNGGPWASSALQAILSESSLPQKEVDGCIGSELPVFLELRVLFLLSRQRVGEAMALARCCACHPVAGRHAFFLQVYLTWLCKTSQHERLQQEVAIFNGKDAVHIICSLESEEDDELLLALCTAFLSQQLRRGDLYYLCDLVLVWTTLHSRVKTPTEALLEESRRLMLSATNVCSIFPVIRAILQEAGEAGVQFCVELCANALQSRLQCDATTKTLIYKTIAGLLPSDLEVCRACALLVFFLERSVESYKMVYLLYLHPDQEYHVDSCPIGNRVRFETLQILKKDLCFDPEFWNLIALRTSCLELMSEKVVSAALEEIMEDKWISNFCKDSALRLATSACRRERRRAFQAADQKRNPRDSANATSKRLKAVHSGKKRGCQASQTLSGPLRRSFWQMERLRDNGEHRRTTRLSEKNPQKRRIRTPRWLLEDSGTLDNKVPLKMKKHHRSTVISRSEDVPFKNNIRHKPTESFDGKTKETNGIKHQRRFLLDGPTAAPAAQVVLELSLPDNELLFTEDACSRPRGLPQVLLYKPTVKLPEASQPTRTSHGKEVVLRARDAAMLVQQLHCYTRKQKGKGVVHGAHGSVSTITRSSMQGSPPKAGESLQVLRRLPSAREVSEKSTKVLSPDCEEPAVEMKVTIASPSPVLDQVCKAKEEEVSDPKPPVPEKVSDVADPNPIGGNGEQKLPHPERTVNLSELKDSKATCGSAPDDNGLSALTLVTEIVRELPSEQRSSDLEQDKRQDSGTCASEDSNSLHKMLSTSSCSVPHQEVSLTDGPGSTQGSCPMVLVDDELTDSEPETEESKLDYCCTFCNKDFKGRRVVEHAMFHYRRDECMFCGVTFKDDLLAMMHLSNHIEKLKRLKETPGTRVRAKGLSDTKDTSTKVQPKNTSSECAKRGRLRRSSQSQSSLDLNRSGSRTLRSNKKAVDESEVGSKATGHRLNGHTGKRKDLKRLKHNLKAEISQETKSDGVTNRTLRKHNVGAPSEPRPNKSLDDPNEKQKRKVAEEKSVASEEKVCCPVDGCSWSTDLSKNRVGLLYHALEDHHGQVEPLRLAFSRGNSKCSVCMRVTWSFEHFRHHVERHRLTPRHPCLHQGCSARFKTGMEMRRHTRKHSPLQAACCLPGCSRLFICLWALNLHEREHYAGKSGVAEAARKNRLNLKHASPKTHRKLAEPPEQEAKPAARASRENVLENLSNKDASAPPTPPRLKLRLRTAASAPSKVHKVISSFMRRCRRFKLKKKQVSVEAGPRKRGRPPKIRRDENTASLRNQRRRKQESEGTRKQVQAKESRPRRPLKRGHVEGKVASSIVSPPSVKRSRVEEELVSSSSSRPPSASPEHKTPTPTTARRTSHTRSLKSATRKHCVSSALTKCAKSAFTVLQPDSKVAEAGVQGSKEEDEQTEPGDAKPPVPLPTTQGPQSPQSEGKPKNVPVPATTENPQNLPVPPTTENPQSLQSEDKPKNVPVPPTTDKPGNFAVPQTTQNPQNLPVPPTTENPQSPPSEDKLKKLRNKKKGDPSSHTKKNKTLEKRPCRTSVPSKCEVKQEGGANGGAALSSPPEEGGASSQAVKKCNASRGRTTVLSQDENRRQPAECESPPQLLKEVLAEAEPSSSADTPPTPPPQVTRGQTANDGNFSVCKETLEKYRKKPYLRLPPTAYLDEKYTTMPKRRKEMSFSPESSAPKPAASPLPPHRQRCANCFATFHCAQELQSHVTLKKCSALFGFDSDNDD
ncbi:unnamed protein product [Ophioblennius macclurei]